MLLLGQGDWSGSLRQNALAVPMTLLFMLSLGLLAREGIRGRRLRLPQGMFLAWIVVLSAAWVIQLSRAALAR